MLPGLLEQAPLLTETAVAGLSQRQFVLGADLSEQTGPNGPLGGNLQSLPGRRRRPVQREYERNGVTDAA
jgi:hypothetical protein